MIEGEVMVINNILKEDYVLVEFKVIVNKLMVKN